MTAIVDRSFIGGTLPKNLAARAIDTDHFERVFEIGAYRVRVNKVGTVQKFVCDAGLPAGDGFAVECSSQEDFLVPHDRRRVAASFDRGLPLNVLRAGPFDGETCLRRDALAFRPTPLRPV
jgi:hypothetical protein